MLEENLTNTLLKLSKNQIKNYSTLDGHKDKTMLLLLEVSKEGRLELYLVKHIK